MAKTIYVKGRPCPIQPAMVIGQGGEAVIYRLKGGEVLKLYMEPSDPMYAGNPDAQQGARLRLEEQQQKLPAFPRHLPAQVVAPLDLAYSGPGKTGVAGFTMPFLRGEVLLSYSDRRFRERSGIDANQVLETIRNLHGLVAQVHKAGVVIGDFNDLNVLVDDKGQAYLIDADSMQFGQFPCRTFTARFVDPLLCEADRLVLMRPHGRESDWYAFTTMLFQCLMYINPYYGGVHRPKSGKQYKGDARVLNRLTVFSPDIIYPKAALPLSSLPDELLEYFRQMYEHDKRGDFPRDLLDNLRWTECPACHIWHARAVCPVCTQYGAARQVVKVRGTVHATRLFQTRGRILYATYQQGELKYVYYEDGVYRREGGQNVLRGELDSGLRLRLWSDKTVFAKGSRLIVLDQKGDQEHFDTDMVGQLPIFDANADHLYWVNNGYVVHEGKYAPFTIGETLPGQTLLWAGQRFGFGFYRAGTLTRGLIFDTDRAGINDSVPLPPLRGNLIDACCAFSDHQVWFMLSIQEGGVIYRHCYVINDKAELVAQLVATQGDGTWLGDGIRGHLAMGPFLYAATDSGIIRVVVNNGAIVVEREFPDTEPFVNTDSQLLPGKGGITAVSSGEILLLKMQ